jgi:hypothetical protein
MWLKLFFLVDVVVADEIELHLRSFLHCNRYKKIITEMFFPFSAYIYLSTEHDSMD